MSAKIPLTVIVTTKNEEKNLPRCLSALERFDEVIVVDSNSADATADIARSLGATLVPYTWDGRYPKKRQWCLDTLLLRHDRVFFVDADEEVTPALCDEIAALDWHCAGYFVKGAYVIEGKVLRFGLKNNKLCLFDRRLIEFPVVDDLDIPGMGEIEGHYQPVLKGKGGGAIKSLKIPLLHHAMDDMDRYNLRHLGYAQWQTGVKIRNALPPDPVFARRVLKTMFHRSKVRPCIAFLYSYIIKLGFLDGRRGLNLSKHRFFYYHNTILAFLITISY